LAALVVFHLSIDIVWATRDLAPPWWDQAGYYWGNLRLWEKLENGGIFQFLGAVLKFKDRSPLFKRSQGDAPERTVAVCESVGSDSLTGWLAGAHLSKSPGISWLFSAVIGQRQ
jgi:hypothetical protein